MAKTSSAWRLQTAQAAFTARRPGWGSGEPPAPPLRGNPPVIGNAQLATLMLLGAEAMFFAGLIGAYIVFRFGAPVWPPAFQPRLPLGVTGVNTGILLLSAFTMRMGLKKARSGDRAGLVRALTVTALMGGIFLVIQGYEWLRLIHFGLTVSSSIYGGLFYTLIGFHGLHVLGALGWLVVVWFQARHGRFSKDHHVGLVTCAMYWIFVVALWPVLYAVVYLY